MPGVLVLSSFRLWDTPSCMGAHTSYAGPGALQRRRGICRVAPILGPDAAVGKGRACVRLVRASRARAYDLEISSCLLMPQAVCRSGVEGEGATWGNRWRLSLEVGVELDT